MRGDAATSTTEAPVAIQRKCEACEEEELARIQRRAASSVDAGARLDGGAAVRVTKRPAPPLPPETRIFFERRFGQDFSRVRVHADGEAARAADAVRARAYTFGSDIVFGAHEYDPHGNAGRRLLAHELSHVVQQSRGAPSGVQAKLRAENPGDALPGVPARQKWEDVRDYVRALSSGGFDVPSAGTVAPTGRGTCTSPVRTSDLCLCELHASADDWKIKIDDIDWPHTEPADHRVTVHSTRSPVEFGAWGGGAQAGTRISQDNARALGHELCGHAWLMERGTHPTGPPPVLVGGQLMGRPSHDPTVAIENVVAGEMTPGAPTRGKFADPHHGESFARITVSGYATGATDPSTLPPDMKARLVRAKDAMLSRALMRADVVGHADHSGSASANASASLVRAQRVRSHLIGLGVGAGEFIEVVGRGDAECPAGPADDPACRKVEVLMFMFQGSSLRNP
jgi:outer membrane protein OmpA-like peptidoglycan-associated protein